MNNHKLFLLQTFSKKLKISNQTMELIQKIQKQLTNQNKIYFYDWKKNPEKRYYFLSNYYYSPFKDGNNKTWGTSEAYFQTQKYVNTDHLTSERDKKNFKKFARILRKEFQDAPDFVKKLAGSKAVGFGMVAFMGIDQPNATYSDKDEKKEAFQNYKELGMELNAKYKKKDAPKETKLKPININLWESRDPKVLKGNRIYAMIEALVYKFQNPKLKKKLLATNDSLLVENNSRDSFWAIGDKTGLNILGKLLVILRNVIQVKESPQDQIKEILKILKIIDIFATKKGKCTDYISYVDEQIVFGRYPGFPANPQPTVKELEDLGYTVFVDVTNKGNDMKTSDVVIPYETKNKYFSYFIVDKKVPEDMKSYHEFVTKVSENIGDNDKVYIHCRGGSGRGAVFAATLLVIMKGYNAEKALKDVYEAHQKRKLMREWLRKLGAPQNDKQKQFIRDFEKYHKSLKRLKK